MKTARETGVSVHDLVVLDRLEVGPVCVEARRVSATYTVEAGGTPRSTELVYSFQEDVFDDGPDSRNLAAMMVAQVALNYGLFCKRLVFHGPFDEHDRRLLRACAENTAREIYVNKFLSPNPFLVGPAVGMKAVRQPRYLNADIEFTGDSACEPGRPWLTRASTYAVLSSGGKDSLVSFGVLRELGCKVHPIFVNESGRHWYTALNAYRHLSNRHLETARVWTNSDRVFSWMLQRLPFVRRDFFRVRSDEYPIRLWTVAVFLFGVLPLVRKHGIGRVVIGNEYDTTVKTEHDGITNYNALYDQSRFFDDRMTRYYRRKGWNIDQFSILRPLSELLVQKTLVERFPELLACQVSCHAAHIERDRVHPCGSCEKCRRIVGMLKALGTTPARCGYGEDQARRCLRALVDAGVHQERAGSEQLAHMLDVRGLLSAPSPNFRPRRHPEVMSLRFHPKNSPVDDIPDDIRAGIYGIFLEHAEGALNWQDGAWVTFDPRPMQV